MQRQLSPLTGLRGVAAYVVLIAHAVDNSFYYSGQHPFHPITARFAVFAMSLFFVLSGFVIQHNYGELFAKERLGRALYQFFVARFARLYPLYALTLIPALAYIPSPFFAGKRDVALAYVALTQSWFNMEMAAFSPDWSISTEWFFYWAFVPLTLLLLRRRFVTLPLARWPLATLLAAGVTGLLVLSLGLWYSHDSAVVLVKRCCIYDPNVSTEPWVWLSYFSPYVRLPEFIMGVLTAKAYAALSGSRQNPWIARLVIACSLIWCATFIGSWSLSQVPLIKVVLPNFLFAPALAPLLLICCRHDGMLSRALSSKPLMFAGQISYSVYIWSWSAIVLLDHSFVSSEPSRLAYVNSTVKVVVCVGFTTVFAYGSYLLIEAPARSFIRAKLMAGAAVTAAAVRRAVSATAYPVSRALFARIMHVFGPMRGYATPRSDHAVHSRRFLRRFVEDADNQRREGAARNRVEALDPAE